MSIVIHPNQTFKLWLPQFDDTPIEDRPVFVFRRLNGLEYSEIRDTDAEGTFEERCDRTYQGLTVGLVGWRHQIDPSTGETVAFSTENTAELLKQIVDPHEAYQLLNDRLLFGALNREQRKKYESRR